MKLMTRYSWQHSRMGYRKVSFYFFFLYIYKNDLKTMSDVLYKATKYMNAEDALLARKEKLKKRERQKVVR